MDILSGSRAIPESPPNGENIIPSRIISIKSPLWLFLLSFLIVLLLFTILSGVLGIQKKVFAAPIQDNTGYPYLGQSRYEVDPWGFYKTECVSYVAYRVNFAHKSTSLVAGDSHYFYNSIFSSLDDYRFGDGGHWDDALMNAINDGYSSYFYIDKVPAIGSAAVWNPTPNNSYGHVAYVEYVYANGNINVSEYNKGSQSNDYQDHVYGERNNIAPADWYIHFNSPVGGNYGSVNGKIYNNTLPYPTVNLNSSLITATVSSNNINNTDFFYQRSYYGNYNLALPAGFVTLSVSDGVNWSTIKNLAIFNGLPRALNITLDNKCRDFATNSVINDCSTTPMVLGANSGGGTNSGGVTGTGTVCTTPPSSSSNVDGSTQGNNGWWRSSTQVSLFATAPCGYENLKTYYSINGGSQQQYSGPFSLNSEGIYNINYYSVDKLGNTESSRSLQVKIDWTPPVTTGTATGPRDTNGIFRDDVTAGITSTDNLSGVESQQRSVDGGANWVTMQGGNNTFPITGIGVSRFVFRATDVAGNLETFKDSGPIIINKYVIYTNGTADSLRFLYSTGVNISGDIYSGGSLKVYGNTGSVFGTTLRRASTSNYIYSGNTNVSLPTIQNGVAPVPMLSYPLSLYKSLATVVFPSDLYMNSVSSQLKGIIYVEGNVEMTDVGLSGPVSIVATGSIKDFTTDSSFQTGDPNNGVLLYAGNNIEVNSTGNRNLGLMYAPNGMIKIRATGLTLKGSLVGKEVELNGATNFNLSYSAAFAPSTYALPLTAMGLVANTNPLPPLPPVTSPSKPSKGSQQYVSKVKFSWGSSTNAVGYNLQIARDAAFSDVVFNGSYLSTGASVTTLQKNVKYYWRVSSINSAGMSNWSTVWDFTGK